MGVQVQVKTPLVVFKTLDKWLPKKKELQQSEGTFADEIKQIKDILKDHDMQNNLLPLKFHRHVKPPVHPPKRLLTQKEVVSGKAIPFTKVMVKKERIALKAKQVSTNELMGLKTIFETEDYERMRKHQHAPPILMYK
ncbi:Aste57867_15524 [Aphanomyces stellatus]|uniref:Aste57867_15524 protein n=1 Tax=Aphanomyces stellatus TaxID=120398 RepID=A0A485L4A3_9STRA|nr:hypothetical protein As57867_015468 [Aphanomyces stellatus]VFT92326.1 Aste57867_15524 [Aphanomyces stellatus]